MDRKIECLAFQHFSTFIDNRIIIDMSKIGNANTNHHTCEIQQVSTIQISQSYDWTWFNENFIANSFTTSVIFSLKMLNSENVYIVNKR